MMPKRAFRGRSQRQDRRWPIYRREIPYRYRNEKSSSTHNAQNEHEHGSALWQPRLIIHNLFDFLVHDSVSLSPAFNWCAPKSTISFPELRSDSATFAFNLNPPRSAAMPTRITVSP
jgi:hypothetical protein